MGHTHVGAGRHRGPLIAALIAALTVFVVEAVGAVVSDSLSLLADAGHVLGDAGGVGLALGASLLAGRPPTGRRTFGWARAEVLAAACNALVLVGIGGYVLVEGVRRLIEPSTVDAGRMALFAALGLVGNLVGVVVLFRSRHANLNTRGAFLEVATDTAASVGVLLAAAVVTLTGFTRADALVSVVIGLMVLPRALHLLREAANVLLEAAPHNVDPQEVRRHLRALPHVRGVHDLHVHTVTSGLPVLTAHVVVDAACFRDGRAPGTLDAAQECLSGHFDLEHSTIQLEPDGHANHEHSVHT